MHFTASLHGFMLVQLWLKDDPQKTCLLFMQSVVFESPRGILKKVRGGVCFTLTLFLKCVCMCVCVRVCVCSEDSEIGQLGFRAERC